MIHSCAKRAGRDPRVRRAIPSVPEARPAGRRPDDVQQRARGRARGGRRQRRHLRQPAAAQRLSGHGRDGRVDPRARPLARERRRDCCRSRRSCGSSPVARDRPGRLPRRAPRERLHVLRRRPGLAAQGPLRLHHRSRAGRAPRHHRERGRRRRARRRLPPRDRASCPWSTCRTRASATPSTRCSRSPIRRSTGSRCSSSSAGAASPASRTSRSTSPRDGSMEELLSTLEPRVRRARRRHGRSRRRSIARMRARMDADGLLARAARSQGNVRGVRAASRRRTTRQPDASGGDRARARSPRRLGVVVSTTGMASREVYAYRERARRGPRARLPHGRLDGSRLADRARRRAAAARRAGRTASTATAPCSCTWEASRSSARSGPRNLQARRHQQRRPRLGRRAADRGAQRSTLRAVARACGYARRETVDGVDGLR